MVDTFTFTMESSTAADKMKRWSSTDLLIIPTILLSYFLFNFTFNISKLDLDYFLQNLNLIIKIYIVLILFMILIYLIKNKKLYVLILLFSLVFLYLYFTFSNLLLFFLILFILNFGKSENKDFSKIFSEFRKNITYYTIVLFLISFIILFKFPQVSYAFVKSQISKPLEKVLNNTYYQITKIYKQAYLQGVRDTLYYVCINNPYSCKNIDEIYKELEKSYKPNLNEIQFNIDNILNGILQKFGFFLYIILTAIYINVLDILIKIFIGLPTSIILTFIKRYIEK